MSFKLPDHAPSMLLAQDVKEICRELFLTTPVSYFFYAKYYDDDTCIALPIDADVHQYSVNNRVGFTTSRIKRLLAGVSSKKLLLTSSLPGYATCLKQRFGLCDYITFISVKPDHYEIIGFASHDPSTKPLEFYLNHPDLLQKFSHYFKDRASDLIQQSSTYRIPMPADLPVEHNTLFPEISSPMKETGSLFSLRKLPISINGRKTYLTAREVECLGELTTGSTAKMIARKLNISPRTVEAHIANIKQKLDCHHKSQLIGYMRKIVFT